MTIGWKIDSTLDLSIAALISTPISAANQHKFDPCYSKKHLSGLNKMVQ